MNFKEYENDSDGTYCSQSDEIASSQVNLPVVLETIKNKIWLHINKREFFNRASIDYYFNLLKSIKTADTSLQPTIQSYLKQLQSLRKGIENYEESIKHSSASIFSGITQDQEDLQAIRATNDGANNLGDNIPKSGINKSNHPIPIDYCASHNYSIGDISESLLSNVDFKYSDNKGNQCKTTSKDIVADSFLGNESEKPSKRRKFTDSEMEELKSTNHKFADREEMCEFLERRKHVLECMEKQTVPDLSGVKGNMFEDPVIAKAYVDRMNTMIESFNASFVENIEKLVDERERKLERKLAKESSKVSSAQMNSEMGESQESSINLEDLSSLFARMFEET